MSGTCIYHGGGGKKRGFSSEPVIPVSEDKLVRVTATDTTSEYLSQKILVDGSLSAVLINPGANEKLGLSVPAIPAPDSFKLKITGADTTENYLDSKLAVSGNVSKSVLNPGVNEQLQITVPAETGKAFVSAADTTKNFLDSKIVVSGNVSKSILNPGANETLQIAVPAETGKVLVSAADTTKNFLDSKISVGAGLTKSITSPGANEVLNIALSGSGSVKCAFPYGTGLALDAGVFMVPGTAASSYPVSGMGYYFSQATTLMDIFYNFSRFVTYSTAESITMQIRRVTADGSRTTEIVAASGTLVRQTICTFGINSAGNFRYYKGFSDTGLNIAIAAGEMVIVVCSAKTANSVTGGCCHLNIEQ